MPMVRRQWRINPLTDIAANVNLETLLFDFISWKCFVTFLHKLMFHEIDILSELTTYSWKIILFNIQVHFVG